MTFYSEELLKKIRRKPFAFNKNKEISNDEESREWFMWVYNNKIYSYFRHIFK